MLALYGAGFWLFFCQVTPNTLGSGYTKSTAFFMCVILMTKVQRSNLKIRKTSREKQTKNNMKKLNLIKIGLFLIILPILMTSCRTPMRFTYTAQNLKGNAVMDEENMLADYGKFSILYTAFGGVTIINKSD